VSYDLLLGFEVGPSDLHPVWSGWGLRRSPRLSSENARGWARIRAVTKLVVNELLRRPNNGWWV